MVSGWDGGAWGGGAGWGWAGQLLSLITAEPDFFRISGLPGTDNLLGSRDPELEADNHEAIFLKNFRIETEVYSPFPVESSDDRSPGSYIIEEFDEALVCQAAEDAQKELDEAFERVHQQICEDV